MALLKPPVIWRDGHPSWTSKTPSVEPVSEPAADHADHVVLVGMPCVGKTTVGVPLAERLSRPFVDLDHAMQDDTGQTVGELLEQLGETGFLEYEASVLEVALRSAVPAVISTGGSIVLNSSAQTLLAAEPCVVWLQAPLATIAQRVEEVNRAPYIVGLDGSAPLADQLAAIYALRQPHYQQVADVELDLAADLDPAAAAAEIAAQLGLRSQP